MTETKETTETEAPQSFPLPVTYASFNSRVIAACVDIFIVMTFALPVTNWLLDVMFGPIDASPFSVLISNMQLLQNLPQLFIELLKLAKHQNLFLRAFCENSIQILILAVYTLPFWMRYASTPGKMLLRMEIQDIRTGEKLSSRQAIIRFLAYIVSFIPLSLGFVWIACNKKHLGWHDIIAHTAVVIKPKNRTASKQHSSST